MAPMPTYAAVITPDTIATASGNLEGERMDRM